MTKYHCLIVDDEPIAHRILQNYLTKNEQVAACHHASHTGAAREILARQPIDFLLLDIQMPEETGLDFLRSLETRPVTILTTAHLEFALDGYELGVMDYLVKPIRPERFEQALGRVFEFLGLLQLQSTFRSATPETIEIQSGKKTLRLPLSGITHVQGLKDYAILHTPSRRHVLRTTMKNLERILAPHGFVRVHKSFIVTADKLALQQRGRIEFDGFLIPVGRKFRALVKNSAVVGS